VSSREYPSRPIVGVGGVVFIHEQVVLVKRRHAPLAGQWSLPGGVVEVGEPLSAAIRRELREEIGIDTRVGPLIELFDRITRDDTGRVRYHFVLADFLCHYVAGELTAGSDAEQVVLVDPTALSSYRVTAKAAEIVAAGALLR